MYPENVHRSGLDNILIDMMRPLADAGVSPSVFSKFLLEMKSKIFYRSCVDYLEEMQFKKEVSCLKQTDDVKMLSAFADKGQYDGRVPGQKLLCDALLAHHDEVRPYFDLEMKKRGGEEFHVDVSYKVRATSKIPSVVKCV